MQGLWREEQHPARVNHDLPMPHSLRNNAGLALVKVNNLFVGVLDLGPENHVNGTFDEVQQFFLVRMHFPFVPYTGSIHGEDSDVPSIEVHGENFDGRNGARSGHWFNSIHAQKCTECAQS
jgi:hypothetical protein